MGTGEWLLQSTPVATNESSGGGLTPPNATPEGPITEGPVYERLFHEATSATNWLLATLMDWLPNDIARLLMVLIIMSVAWYISNAVIRVLEDRIHQRFDRPSVARTVLRSIRMGILGLGVLLVMISVFKVSGPDLTISVAAFSAMAGVVLAPIVGSVVSGLFVLADQPYEVGDMIELVDTDQRGFVQDITIRYTKIRAVDNTFLVIPNGAMRERDVRNYTAEDHRTRLELPIGITYESDLETAQSVIERVAADCDGVISAGPPIRVGTTRYPARPNCLFEGFGANSVDLELHYWTDEPERYKQVQSRVIKQIFQVVSEHDDVAFAYPHTHLVFDDTSGTMSVAHGDQQHRRSNENFRL
ncbi:mechanosensitive ion channel family protein [Halocatena halophila]|uniref:mechanosensitive ion channel family protein n=1 Tax=Halocatena halophila TaxID=2814576 RepID=UPI002ED5F10C